MVSGTEINILIMDNDSGYASHNQESNLDSSWEDSVINASQSSASTDFGGFNDSGDLTDTVIPIVPPIVVMIDKETRNPSPTKKATPYKTVQTCDNTRRRTDEDTDSNKENIDPTGTPVKQYENRLNPDLSPDLFDDESAHPPTKEAPTVKTPGEKYVITKDLKLLKNVQKGLSGVFPPPSVTFIQMAAADMLQKFKDNENLFSGATETTRDSKSNLITATSTVCGYKPFPDVLEDRFHGLHHNRSKISEEFEQLCVKYGERFVGSETQSTCTIFESHSSPSRRKCPKSRWGAKSPGRRLSHLARRRITFSSANLQAANNSSILGSRARQILVDAKKLSTLKKKSPRKTPSKSPFKVRRSTPSSSAKKRAMRMRRIEDSLDSAPSTSSDSQSFKRALFTSPPRDKTFLGSLTGSAAEKKSTKRALFQSPSKGSPHKKSPFALGLFDSRKRKRSESEENVPPKLPRSVSMDVRPSSECNRSMSMAMANRTLSEASISRLNSSLRSEELSEVHKKKLQWAVYEAMRLQNVGTGHPQFKAFASTLARVTRRFLPSLAGPRLEGRTSERMFRIARHHSYAVVKGKSVDEIVNDFLKSKAKNQRPQGYVAAADVATRGSSTITSRESGVLQDKSNLINVSSESSEKSVVKPKNLNESRIDRIRKVISFERS